jgi:hypothetical protein
MVAVVLAVPRVHRRIGRRAMAAVAVALVVATIAWTKLRHDEAIIGWRTLALIGAVALMYLVSMPDRDDELPTGSPSSSLSG